MLFDEKQILASFTANSKVNEFFYLHCVCKYVEELLKFYEMNQSLVLSLLKLWIIR